MFCHNCGREVGEGAAFCPYCGVRQNAVKNSGTGKEIVNTPGTAQAEPIPSGNIISESIPPANIQKPGNPEKPEKKKKDKGGVTALVLAMVLILAAGIGCVLYFTGDAYISHKNMKLAEECFEAEEYEEALAYYEEALSRNSSLTEAYVRSADIYVLEEEYAEAIKILEKGLKKTREDEESREIIEKKTKEVKRAENAAVTKKFQEYLGNELLPQYGYADLSAKKRTLSWEDSWDENRNWTGALGIANVEICDWDGDERDEMLVIILEDQNIRLCIYEWEGKTPVKTAESLEERCSDMVGYDVIYSMVNGRGVNYLLFREEISGILSDGYTANVKLYRYDGVNFYMPLGVLQTSGGSSDFAYTAYEYDGSGNLLSEEIVYDEVYDHEINYDSAHCYGRMADLFGKYGLALDSAAAINGEKELFDDLEASAEYKELLSLSMWGIYQNDSAVYHFNDWDSPILVYESFLRGEKTARARADAWFADQEQMDLTIWDLLAKVEDEYLEYSDRDTIGRIEYAYLDCGGDGVEELAVKFVGLDIYDYYDDSDIMLVISCKDGELELIYSRDSWARSNTGINYYGCIYTGGSGGAGAYYVDMEYINAESVVQTVYTAEMLGGWWVSYVSEEAYREAFGNMGTDPDMAIDVYDINGSTYHVAYLYDYAGQECWDYAARCEAEGKLFVSEEELEDILKQHMSELGIKEEWIAGNDLYWNWLWY